MTSSTYRKKKSYWRYVLHFPYPCLSLLYFVIWWHDDDNDGNEDEDDDGCGYEDGDGDDGSTVRDDC